MATACLIFFWGGGGGKGGIIYVCFSTHVTSDNIGPLVQSLKLCQKANSSPPWGLALNLPGLSMFLRDSRGSHWWQSEGLPHACLPRWEELVLPSRSSRLSVHLWTVLFLFLINPYPILIRASTTADAKLKGPTWDTISHLNKAVGCF